MKQCNFQIKITYKKNDVSMTVISSVVHVHKLCTTEPREATPITSLH